MQTTIAGSHVLYHMHVVQVVPLGGDGLTRIRRPEEAREKREPASENLNSNPSPLSS